MYEDGGVEYRAEHRPVGAWIRLALVLGVIVALVLLVLWGASASASGGCGGG